MQRAFLIVCCVLLTALSGYSQQARHVVLISIDGFRPEFYLDDSWSAPNLRMVLAEGVHATRVRTVVPSVTYPSHTTIVTGALPARHGIYYNSPKGATNGQWYWEAHHITTPTLWDAVKASGKTSGAVMWPVTVGAPIDHNFPVRRPNKNEKGNQLSITRPLVTPSNLLTEIEKAQNREFSKSDFDHHNIDKTIGLMANHIIAHHKPDLMAIHFLSMDHAGHALGRNGAELHKALALVDSLVGSVVKTIERAGIKDRTTIIITGDHGMVDRVSRIAPNIWLARNGLLSKDHWFAKFHPAGGSAWLYLKRKNDTKTLESVEQILAKLPEEERRMFRVVGRKELDALGANPEPALALAFSRGVSFDQALSGEVVRPVKSGGAHGYFPDFPEIMTGFIAAGAGIRRGHRVDEIALQDIAPCISRLLGIDLSSPDGEIPEEIFVE